MQLISLLSLWLPFAAAAKSTYTPCMICIHQASPEKLAEIKLRLYGTTINNYTSVRALNASELLPEIDKTKPTVIFTFGWLGSPDLPSTKAVVGSYIDRQDHNVMLLDWQTISINELSYVERSVESVGYVFATAIDQLEAGGLNTTGLDIVGHSLGAQVSGYAGRFVNKTLPRIIGLDPGGPGFYFIFEHLSSSDAKFVVIIHTDRGGIGINLQTGHVDFYPNNGVTNQPGCVTLNICSHYRSCYYYAESVRNENAFLGRQCDSYSEFNSGLCNSNSTVVMGYATPSNATGRVYLKTNSNSPYGRGIRGATGEGSILPITSFLREYDIAMEDRR